MRTVLIAHRDTGFASSLAGALLKAGYRTISCPGPWPPALRCIRHDVGYCPLSEGADLLIYDPDLVSLDHEGKRHSLALDTAQAHPDVPVLLAWPGREEPPTVASILSVASNARRANREGAALVEQVRELVGPPVEPTLSYRRS